MLRKSKFPYNLTFIKCTLHETLCTFLIISSSFLLRMRNVLDQSCKENHNTYIMFSNLLPKIVRFVIQCGKLQYSQISHTCQYNMVHAHFMLDDKGYRHRICYTCCFLTRKMVTRMLVIVAFTNTLPVFLNLNFTSQSRTHHQRRSQNAVPISTAIHHTRQRQPQSCFKFVLKWLIVGSLGRTV